MDKAMIDMMEMLTAGTTTKLSRWQLFKMFIRREVTINNILAYIVANWPYQRSPGVPLLYIHHSLIMLSYSTARQYLANMYDVQRCGNPAACAAYTNVIIGAIGVIARSTRREDRITAELMVLKQVFEMMPTDDAEATLQHMSAMSDLEQVIRTQDLSKAYKGEVCSQTCDHSHA